MTDVERSLPTSGTEPLAAGVDAPSALRTLRSTVGAYVALTKPRIIELLLVTTLPAMLLAAGGWPPTAVVVATLVGGSAAAGGANALNCFIDRDIDAVMRRTARRPLNGSDVSPTGALVFGTVLGLVAVGLLWRLTNPLAAALTAGAIVMYVVGYTLLLKRRTPSNIVWGGSAGCMPTLIGWAAVTGRLSLAPFVLFGIVFFWTPPHFWALAMRFREDYAAAGVPMLPVVATSRVVTQRMAVYTWVTVATSLVLWPVAGTGLLYPGAAVVLGAGFLREVERLRRSVARGEVAKPMRVFHWSITYLSGLFLCLALDVLVRSWW
ncbi:MAG: heme o synthase [Actinomycetota bacterium]|nr:heme o synthase [Actinomycetota bacterium]